MSFEEEEEEEEKHILVSGKVQGVWFRVFTSKRAQELNLSGWVRNLTNGSVEILVKGHPLKLKEFISKIKKGPKEAHVNRLIIKNMKNEKNPLLKPEDLNFSSIQKENENFLILNTSSKALVE